MLRSEFPFAIVGWPRRILAVLLGEAFLGFLAIVAVGLALFPMLFSVKPAASAAIDTAQWGIIGWFAFEFVFAFTVAREKPVFLTNPWRWLDLVTIAVPLASLLPSVSRTLRSSPVLRLVRIGRLVSLGVRASGWTTRHRARQGVGAATHGPAQVTRVSDSDSLQPAPEPASMEGLLKWLKSPGAEWFHVSNPSPDELKQIAAATKLPAGFLETHLLSTNYPHWATAGGRTGMFLWMPEFDAVGNVERFGMFFLPTGEGLLSLSRRQMHAIERFQATEPDADKETAPFAVQMLQHVLERVVSGNERLAGRYEEQLHELENVPVRNSQPDFFEKTFRLKKELSAAQADLWRLKGMTVDLAGGRVTFGGKAEASEELYRRRANDVDYLYETMVNIREEVLSVIELHLNVVSFEMNRVMRVLAVVSCLGLVPAVVGGLFGMNLADNPWPFTLPQVAFAIFFAMVLGLYFFFVKGWLR